MILKHRFGWLNNRCRLHFEDVGKVKKPSKVPIIIAVLCAIVAISLAIALAVVVANSNDQVDASSDSVADSSDKDGM